MKPTTPLYGFAHLDLDMALKTFREKWNTEPVQIWVGENTEVDGGQLPVIPVKKLQDGCLFLEIPGDLVILELS